MFYKEIYVFDGERPVKAVIRNYGSQDFDGMIRIQQECFPPPYPAELWWNREQLASHVERFQQGALCVEIGGQLAGSVTSLIVDYDPQHAEHTWEEVADQGYIRTHRPDGNALYVIDIAVRPAFRKLGLGKWLLFSLYDVVVELKLDRLLGAGRMPGYHAHADRLTAEQYADAVLVGELRDPVLTFLLRCGRMPVQVLPDYLEDEQSCNYALLMEWRNPFRSRQFP